MHLLQIVPAIPLGNPITLFLNVIVAGILYLNYYRLIVFTIVIAIAIAVVTNAATLSFNITFVKY